MREVSKQYPQPAGTRPRVTRRSFSTQPSTGQASGLQKDLYTAQMYSILCSGSPSALGPASRAAITRLPHVARGPVRVRRALDVRIAARLPIARQGTVEIRPVIDIPGRPMRVPDATVR